LHIICGASGLESGAEDTDDNRARDWIDHFLAIMAEKMALIYSYEEELTVSFWPLCEALTN
jgi:hypothetical protein